MFSPSFFPICYMFASTFMPSFPFRHFPLAPMFRTTPTVTPWRTSWLILHQVFIIFVPSSLSCCLFSFLLLNNILLHGSWDQDLVKWGTVPSRLRFLKLSSVTFPICSDSKTTRLLFRPGFTEKVHGNISWIHLYTFLRAGCLSNLYLTLPQTHARVSPIYFTSRWDKELLSPAKNI